jgi:ribulose-5-phosphate 4-epimerase/fuculose-1-phosphate aldolase
MQAMGSGYAVLLQNHGVFAVGPTMDMALVVAYVVEEAASVAAHAVLLSDQPHLLTEQDFQDMLSGGSKG